MEVKIKKSGLFTELTIVFIIDDENKVYLHYFVHSEEVKDWSSLSISDREEFERISTRFFNENSELIKWSY